MDELLDQKTTYKPLIEMKRAQTDDADAKGYENLRLDTDNCQGTLMDEQLRGDRSQQLSTDMPTSSVQSLKEMLHLHDIILNEDAKRDKNLSRTHATSVASEDAAYHKAQYSAFGSNEYHNLNLNLHNKTSESSHENLNQNCIVTIASSVFGSFQSWLCFISRRNFELPSSFMNLQQRAVNNLRHHHANYRCFFLILLVCIYIKASFEGIAQNFSFAKIKSNSAHQSNQTTQNPEDDNNDSTARVDTRVDNSGHLAAILIAVYITLMYLIASKLRRGGGKTFLSRIIPAIFLETIFWYFFVTAMFELIFLVRYKLIEALWFGVVVLASFMHATVFVTSTTTLTDPEQVPVVLSSTTSERTTNISY